ncbi:DUF2239 family protein [Agrobacterium sp. O3.4]|uniref:DUF2239 family protein n=1 Tax=Agrobacterium cucumeris TaxID=2862866 RepID=A0ABY8RKD1_9HYPH|nr:MULTISPECIES: DUF2239 family protein [Rhizobium/Agrobacterium group]MCZ7470597.1 DUF2239 family protein [Rhizobium rhizogenes]WHO08046.1 DUF2239 family protein [Agrobacterium cucumeris]
MSNPPSRPCTAFSGDRLLLSGLLAEVAIAIRRLGETDKTILVFDDATGRVVDLDLRGTDTEIVERLSHLPKAIVRSDRPEADTTSGPTVSEEGQNPKSRGRPKLGVVAREVTLLPRQWEWLAAQPGGASAALRRLVDEARKAGHPHQEKRAAQEAAYQFMQAIAGNLPGYEEAIRALFADDRPALEERTTSWPADIRAYALRLAFRSHDRRHS